MDILSQQQRSRAKPEFQAIILSGLGTRLGPLIESHGDDPTPKALLPINNKPMVSYCLSWLEEADIREALIVCPPKHVSGLTDHIQATSPILNVEIHAYDSESEESTSTVAILKKISSRIQTDFIVLSCDFVPAPDLKLSRLLNLWRADISEIIMASLFHEASDEAQKRKDEPLPTTTFRGPLLLGVSYNAKSDVRIPMHLFTKFGQCRMSSRLADSHVYIFRRSVLDLLPMVPELKSIKKDLVPFLCSLQYSRTKRKRYADILISPEKPTTANNVQDKGSINLLTAFQYSTTQELEFQNAKPQPRSRTPTTPAKPGWDEEEEDSNAESAPSDLEEEDPSFIPALKCGLLLHRDGNCGRAFSLASYKELNQMLLKATVSEPKRVRDGVDAKAQISANSSWSASSKLGEGSVVASSAVGQHCTIGANCRIINSVVMEHVEIGYGVKVENCILSRHTKIGEKAELKDCESVPGAEISGGASYKGVRLSSKMSMAVASSDEDEDDEEE
ncbi:hypothetical protein FRC20_003324 [Serendipita sp. 405]|nr:hypothetical protein FRC20_003324 [Serendipita sp. 405]